MPSRLVALPLLSLFSLGLVACNDPRVDQDDLGDVDFAALCGQDGPVELLALAADEEMLTVDRIGDGDEIHVRVMVDEERGLDEPPQVLRSAVIDACGGVIAELASPAYDLQRWGDVLVGCIDGDLVWLTDYDDPSPSVLVRGSCSAPLVGDRRVAIDGRGSVVTIDTEGSAVMVRELVEAGSIDIAVRPGDDGEILVQTPELAVERVDPHTGARELLLAQAAEQRWGIQSDAMAYQLPSADPDAPSPVILRDRRTGAEQPLDPGFPVVRFGWYDEALLLTAGADPDQLQWYRLDPVRALELPADTTLVRLRHDGLLLLERHNPTLNRYELLLWREGESPQLEWACPSCSAIVIERANAYSGYLMQTADPGQQEMWRFDRAGGPPRLVGNAIGSGTVLDDDRVLSVRVGDDREHGPLLLAHELGEDDVTLAPRVDISAIRFTIGFDAPGEVVYEAVDDDGTSTLERARLGS